MLTFALALGLVTQAPSTPPGPAPVPSAPIPAFATTRDLSFALATEEWVRQARRVGRLDDALIRPDADLVRRLACNHYACRAAAVREIEAKGDAAFRLLFYGKRHRDGQVKFTCTSIFDNLYTCKFCGGSGRCPHPGAAGFQDCYYCGYMGVCYECRGDGLAKRLRRESPTFVRIER